MRFRTPPQLLACLCLYIVLCGAASAEPHKPNDFYKKGQKAEAGGDFISAFAAYARAHQAKPEDLRYRTSWERLRPLAAAVYLHQGETLEKASNLKTAAENVLHALAIDPSNQAASQVLQRLRAKLGEAEVPVPIGSDEMRVLPQHGGPDAAPPVEFKQLDQHIVTLHMTEDVRFIYMALGKLAGVNVLFDAELPPKLITINLTNETLQNAFRILQMLSQTFYTPVTTSTIFVASDSKTKRQQLETQVLQTFFLANVSQQSDLNDVLTAVRNLFGGGTFQVFAVVSQNAIVARGTPDQLYLTQMMIRDLDQPHSEVVLDISIMQVNHDKLKNLGITLPGSLSVGLQNSSTSTSTSATTSTSSSSSSSSTTLSTLLHPTSENASLTVGQATLNMLLTDSDTQILQNPKMRASDGQKATLKIGSRIPVATGSATSTTTTATTVQFTYIDVGVNIDAQPTIHANQEVTIKLKIEVSSETGTSTISGVSEPIIGQKTIEQTIRLREGEVSLLGGMLEKSDSLSVSGTPILGEIPLLSYLFSSHSHEIINNEIVFSITPHIIRSAPRGTTRAVFTGTSQNMEIHRAEPPATPAPPQVPVKEP